MVTAPVFLKLSLAVALGLGPGLGWADEASRSAEAAPPDLPSEVLEAAPPPSEASATDVATPREDPAAIAPGKAVPEAKRSRYRVGNFVLGFLGGALLGGAYGVLSSGGQDSQVMGTNAAIYGGGAGLLLGFTGLLLGATTPEEAKPPRVEAWARPLPGGLELALLF